MQRQKWSKKQAAENHKKTRRALWKVSIDLCKSNFAVLHFLVHCLPAGTCGSCTTRNLLGSSFPQPVLQAGGFLTSMGNGSEFKKQILTSGLKMMIASWIYSKQFDNWYLPFPHSLPLLVLNILYYEFFKLNIKFWTEFFLVTEMCVSSFL